jgi:hypothetical protein
MSVETGQGGRARQRRRTRELLLGAARELIRTGAVPTVEQAAAAAGVSTSTAEKDWAYARSWLRVAIDRASGHRP